ncbi:hypothetical protein [Mycobacteroides abscessus]|uniref:hypothetical protein n=1 Tax=Mycobacteroides abscessus TaxID=36809 RepID=UPI0005B532A9|nr:hypothetical protein [Mycobacteroides abscessus]
MITYTASRATRDLYQTYADQPGDVVLHEGVSRQVRCWCYHARKQGFAIVHFTDSPKPVVVPLAHEWQAVIVDEEYTGNYSQDTITYAGAPCWSCMDYTCPNADNKGICPESPHYPDNSPDWCNCPDIDNCPVNLAIRADEEPPSQEVVRAFHDRLRRAEARDELLGSLRDLRKHPGKRSAYRHLRWSVNYFISTYRATRPRKETNR